MAGGAIGVGIDVGGTKILAGAVTSEGELIGVGREPSPANADELSHALCAAVDGLVAMLGGDAARITALGLALPGLVQPDGVLRAAPNLGAAEIDLEIGPRLGEPIVARIVAGGGVVPGGPAYDNDATCAAFAEATVGAAAGAGDIVVVISIGTGIGAGLVSAGKVVRGAHGFAGEIGHMTVDPDGPPCPCGKRGCWERFASGPALGELGNRFNGGTFAKGHRGSGPDGALRAEDVVEAVREGDPLARAIVDEFADAVAIGLANVTELLDPTRIVLGGGLMQSADVLLEPIRAAYVARNRPALGRASSDVVRATLGEDAATIGAALLGLERLAN